MYSPLLVFLPVSKCPWWLLVGGLRWPVAAVSSKELLSGD
jgi:hypothetical protein